MIRLHLARKTAVSVALATVVGLTATASGQTRTITPYKKFFISPVSVSSTYDVQPQIQPPPVYSVTDVAAENDYTPPLPREQANNLRAGGLLSSGRGSVKSLFPGPVDGRWIPPDCNFAVGPNHIVCIINCTIAFYTKTGTKLFEQQIDVSNGFFEGTAQTNFVFDPKCYYDPISKRFFVVALDLSTGSSISNALIAVSDDSNPNGTWYKYRVNAVLNSGGSSFWMDYPGFGFNKDGVVVTGNMFGFTGGYYGVQSLVVKKSDLLTGGTAQVSALLDPGVGTMQPARTGDKNIDKIFGVASGGGNAMRFYAITGPGTTNPVLKEIDVAVANYNRPPGPAPSGGNVIDTLDGRVMTAYFRKNRVVAAHTIGLNGAIAVRWYDFNVNTWPASGTPSVKQQGNISQNGAAMHMPAINMNSFEDISVLFTRSSASIPADLMYAARFKNDALGTMGAPKVLQNSSSGGYQSFRWGDYFGCEIDPNDDSTFWGFGMTIGANGGYRTTVQSWQVTTGGISGNPVAPDSIATYLGTLNFGDTVSVSTSDDIYYQIGSTKQANIGQAAGADLTYTIPTDTQSISIALEGQGDEAGGTQMLWLWNWSRGAYELVGSIPMPTSGNTQKVITIPDAKTALYRGANGLVKLRVRGHVPKKPFAPEPVPFTYKVDFLELFVR